MMALRAAAGVAAVLAVAGLAVSGCGDSENGDAPTEPVVAAPWDPCSLSDDVLRQAQLDPATEGPGLAGDPPGRKSCGWTSTDKVGVIATAWSSGEVDQFRDGPGNIDFHDVTVGGRPAVTFRKDGDQDGTFCHLAIPIDDGGLVLMLAGRSTFTKDTTTSMCEVAMRMGNVLVAEMPA